MRSKLIRGTTQQHRTHEVIMSGFQHVKTRAQKHKSAHKNGTVDRVYLFELSSEHKWLRKQLIRKFQGICQGCHQGIQISDPQGSLYATIDHVIPLSKGGDDLISNMSLLCQGCNKKKGNGLTTQGLCDI